MILFDHIEPPATPDIPNRPPPPPPRPPAPSPDIVPVHDPLRPEHPDPVREPPGDKPPVAHRRRETRRRLRWGARVGSPRRRR